ncbi:hypothetical protein K8M07_07165 [Schnuerera sp. xch1]|uniref:hypothetical protein n=1 Tax=Schnuerera sp. xch1 TaxID=2874283 RepID=UPI001CBBE7B9|nr:hypothetical protein [Schnuerera sp. xch1]MBZ2175031.1 hypothetical protein [Schnuerera sp. xch1]
MGIPDNKFSFDIYDVENIKVYLSPELRAKDDEFTMKMVKFLWIKKIYADGLIVMK